MIQTRVGFFQLFSVIFELFVKQHNLYRVSRQYYCVDESDEVSCKCVSWVAFIQLTVIIQVDS